MSTPVVEQVIHMAAGAIQHSHDLIDQVAAEETAAGRVMAARKAKAATMEVLTVVADVSEMGHARAVNQAVSDECQRVWDKAQKKEDRRVSRNARHMVSLLRVGPCKFGWRKAS